MARRTAVVWKCVRPASVVHADRDRYARALAASPSALWIAASSAKTCGSGAPAAAHSASRAFCTSSASTSRPIDRSVHPIIHRAIRCAAASPCAARRSPARVNSASASSNRPSACNAQPRLLRSDASHRLAAGCDDATATASASRFRRNSAAGSVSAKASMWMASTTSTSSPAARASGSRRSRCRFDRPPDLGRLETSSESARDQGGVSPVSPPFGSEPVVPNWAVSTNARAPNPRHGAAAGGFSMASRWVSL